MTSSGAEMAKVFDDIYGNRKWGEGSGSGSDPYSCVPYVRMVREFVQLWGKLYNSSSGVHCASSVVLDVGCGDGRMWNAFYYEVFGRETPNVRYRGIDVSKSALELARKTAIGYGVTQGELNQNEIKSADIILIKDVFQHWPLGAIIKALDLLQNAQPLAKDKLVIITNDYAPCNENCNSEISLGDHRPLNLLAAPFDWPLEWVNSPESGGYFLRSLVWFCASDNRLKQSLVWRIPCRTKIVFDALV